MASRKLASSSAALPYLRTEPHMAPDTTDAELHQQWVNKMVGGEKVGEQILFPDKFYGKNQKFVWKLKNPMIQPIRNS